MLQTNQQPPNETVTIDAKVDSGKFVIQEPLVNLVFAWSGVLLLSRFLDYLR